MTRAAMACTALRPQVRIAAFSVVEGDVDGRDGVAAGFGGIEDLGVLRGGGERQQATGPSAS